MKITRKRFKRLEYLTLGMGTEQDSSAQFFRLAELENYPSLISPGQPFSYYAEISEVILPVSPGIEDGLDDCISNNRTAEVVAAPDPGKNDEDPIRWDVILLKPKDIERYYFNDRYEDAIRNKKP
jgi:hypothetical protein